MENEKNENEFPEVFASTRIYFGNESSEITKRAEEFKAELIKLINERDLDQINSKYFELVHAELADDWLDPTQPVRPEVLVQFLFGEDMYGPRLHHHPFFVKIVSEEIANFDELISKDSPTGELMNFKEDLTALIIPPDGYNHSPRQKQKDQLGLKLKHHFKDPNEITLNDLKRECSKLGLSDELVTRIKEVVAASDYRYRAYSLVIPMAGWYLKKDAELDLEECVGRLMSLAEEAPPAEGHEIPRFCTERSDLNGTVLNLVGNAIRKLRTKERNGSPKSATELKSSIRDQLVKAGVYDRKK